MPHLRRPGPSDIAKRLEGRVAPFSYPEVGATRELGPALPASLAPTYDLDVHEFALGSGRELFERARTALFEWHHFDVSWVEFHHGEAPVHRDQIVASLVSFGGIWFLSPCRVVWTARGEGACNVAAFAYGTLQGHVESGEERFVLSFDPDTEAVHYQIAAFSRPALLLTKLGYPMVRRVQRRFAVASSKALTRSATSPKPPRSQPRTPESPRRGPP